MSENYTTPDGKTHTPEQIYDLYITRDADQNEILKIHNTELMEYIETTDPTNDKLMPPTEQIAEMILSHAKRLIEERI